MTGTNGGNNWPRLRLGDVIDRHNKIIHPGDRASGEAVFVGLEHIEPNTGRRIGSLRIDLAGLTGRKPTFRKGQIVYGYLRPYLNKVWVAEFDGCSSVDQFAFDVRLDRADPNFVAAYMRSDVFLRRSSVVTTTGQLPRISIDEILAVEIDLPPLVEQKRIGGILKQQLAAVDRARAAAAAQLEAAKALPAAYLRDVFEGHEASSWPRQRIGEYAKVQSGYAFKSDWFVDDGIRLLRNANVFQNQIEWDDVVCLPESRRSEFVEFELAVGDIVLTLDRPVVNNGLKVARLSPQDVPALLLQRVGRFRLRPNIDSSFLFAFLNSPRFIDQITGHDQSLGVPHVSPKQVEAVEFPVPDATTQRKVAGQIERQWKIIRGLRESTLEQLEAINAMPAALLRAAFQGQL